MVRFNRNGALHPNEGIATIQREAARYTAPNEKRLFGELRKPDLVRPNCVGIMPQYLTRREALQRRCWLCPERNRSFWWGDELRDRALRLVDA